MELDNDYTPTWQQVLSFLGTPLVIEPSLRRPAWPRIRLFTTPHMVTMAGLERGIPAMLSILGNPRRCCDGLTRRQLLQAGALSLFGTTFAPAPLPDAQPVMPVPGRAR